MQLICLVFTVDYNTKMLPIDSEIITFFKKLITQLTDGIFVTLHVYFIVQKKHLTIRKMLVVVCVAASC